MKRYCSNIKDMKCPMFEQDQTTFPVVMRRLCKIGFHVKKEISQNTTFYCSLDCKLDEIKIQDKELFVPVKIHEK